MQQNHQQDKFWFALQLLKPNRKLLFYGFISLLIVDIADVVPPIIIKTAIDSIEKAQTNLSLFIAEFY